MVRPMVALSTKAERKAGTDLLASVVFLLRGLYSRQCPDFFPALLQVVCFPFYPSELKRNVTANDCVIFHQVDSPSILQYMVSILPDDFPWASLLFR